MGSISLKLKLKIDLDVKNEDKGELKRIET